jgi:hypothetical protein
MSKMPSPFKISPNKLSMSSKKQKSIGGLRNRALDRFNRTDLRPSVFEKADRNSELKRVEDIGQIEIINQQRMAQQHSQAMLGSH